jgi:hypothetical protein
MGWMDGILDIPVDHEKGNKGDEKKDKKTTPTSTPTSLIANYGTLIFHLNKALKLGQLHEIRR